jgi:hypothetical protein
VSVFMYKKVHSLMCNHMMIKMRFEERKKVNRKLVFDNLN